MSDSAFNDDNLFTAARRVRNSIRADDSQGGLMSTDTVRASEHLTKLLDRVERQIKSIEVDGAIAEIVVAEKISTSS
jgi:hypothetical protein